MSEVRPKSRWRKLGKALLWTSLGGLLLVVGLAWYLTSPSFEALVKRRIVAQMERITGGRAELKDFNLSLWHRRAEIGDLIIHGKEGPGEAPFIHVGRLAAQVKVTSLLKSEFGFHWVVIDHPSVHIIVYPDGTTNQPEPALQASSGQSPVEQLFALSINRLDVRHGVLLLNEQTMPLDFSVNDLSADMDYSLLNRRYAGKVLLGRAETKYDDFRPVAWTAEAHFTLTRTSLEVSSLKATSRGLHLEASGRMEDFRQPQMEVDYTFAADLAPAGAIVHRPEVRGGQARLSGRVLWSPKTFSSSGKLAAEDVDWRDANFSVQNAQANAQYTLDGKRLVLSQIHARLLGGEMTGKADVVDWAESGAQQRGVARFQISHLSLAELASGLSVKFRGLDRVGVSSFADGSADLVWRGPLNKADAQIALTFSPPSNVPANQLPVDGRMQASYHGAREELEVSELNVRTRSARINASGSLSSSSVLKVSATTTDLGEWQPLLNALRGPEKIPVALHGSASFEGTARGPLRDATLSGHLNAKNFDSYLPATERAPERPVHWDTLSANIQLSPHAFAVQNGSLRHGGTEIDFDGSIGLSHGAVTPQSPIRARIDARHADLAELIGLAGYSYPVTGTLDGQAQLHGTKADPEGEGTIEVTNASVYQQRVQRLTGSVQLAGNEISMRDIDVLHDDSTVKGSVAFNLSSHVFQADLTGANFDLAALPWLQRGHYSVEGRAGFVAKLSGTREEPAINGTLSINGLALDHTPVGDFKVDAVTEGADLRLNARSTSGATQFDGQGTAHLRGNWPSDLTVRFSKLNVDALLQPYLKGRLNSHVTVAGDVRVQGPLREPAKLNVTGNLSDLSIAVEDLEFKNQGPLRFAVSDRVLHIDQFHLTGERTDLSASGTMQLSGDRKLDLQVRGRANLRLIESLDRDFTSSGVLTVDMAVDGTMTSPAAQGRLEIRNGAISYIDLPSGLSEINGTLAFNQDRVQIGELTARTGGGLVTFQGFATAHNRQFSWDLSAHGEDVRLRYPPGISSTASLDVKFAGTSSGSTLSGNVTVNRVSMTPGFDFGAYLAASSRTTALAPTDPVLNKIRLDLHIVTTPELQMQTSIARVSGDADLYLRGTAGKPNLLGRADLTEGDVYFNGTKYRLERGEVSFLSSAGIKPVLDLQMSTRVRDYDINVRLNGEPSKLRLNYSSEPPLPEADIVALLALGRTREESARLQQSGSAFGQEASNAILSEALNAAVSNRVQRLFGGSRIKIDPQGLATETSPSRGPQITIEQQVANNLTLTYSTNVSQASQQIIQVEYNVSRNISIVGLRDQNGVVSFDVRIRQRKK